MRRSVLLLALASFALLTGCSTVQIETDYDRAADFSKYSTYRWILHTRDSEDNPMMRDQLIRSHIKNSVDAVMAQKGFVKIESGEPDFLIAYFYCFSWYHVIFSCIRLLKIFLNKSFVGSKDGFSKESLAAGGVRQLREGVA